MKKQVKKLSKKILILSIATSLIFTTCFSASKKEVKASSIAVALSAYSLYEICLYFGGLAVTALGVGYAYENRDEIAEFGKTVIDSMSNLSGQGWILGSTTTEGNYVYGTEALKEVQDSSWTVIQGGGGSPKNDDDNDGDGDKDADDRTMELDLTGYFLTQAGVNFFNDTIKPIYDKWVNKEEDNILDDKYGIVDAEGFKGFRKDSSGKYYLASCEGYFNGYSFSRIDVMSTAPMCVCIYPSSSTSSYTLLNFCCPSGEIRSNNGGYSASAYTSRWLDSRYGYWVKADVPIFTTSEGYQAFINNGDYSGASNVAKSYRVADWIAEDDEWKGCLEDLSTSLRSLQDLTSIAQRLSSNTYVTQPSADAYGDMLRKCFRILLVVLNLVIRIHHKKMRKLI